MQAERTNSDVLTLRHDEIEAGWEQRYLLIADVHFDSPYCDRRLLTKLLDQAVERKAKTLVFGDWFDAMGAKEDRRSSKETVRPENQKDNYFDILVYDSTDYLEPYHDTLLMMSLGNHCKAVEKHNETNLLERLCRALGVEYMGYSGFLRFMFAHPANGGGRSSKVAFFHHGSGGGGPVTKGVIQANRRAASVEADIFISGHIHESWVVENVMAQLSNGGVVRYRQQYHVCLPTFKQEYDLKGGFHVEKGRPPKPLGGWWLVWHYDISQPGRVGCRFERAS